MNGIPLIVDLPHMAKAMQANGQQRNVYFEASRGGVVDREGEEVAVEALWRSRELMLDQGDLDIAHWSHLPNPNTGRPDPGYRIGVPVDIKRQGRSVYVKGTIYSNLTPPPPESSGDWAEKFWHSQVGQNPPAKWFPSVYGRIKPGGVEVVEMNGRMVRRIIDVEWHSVGFALRAQHPDLGPVSLEPMGTLAKADNAHQGTHDALTAAGGLRMTWGTFAKAVSTVGAPITDHAALTGVQSLTKESTEKRTRKVVAAGAAGDARVARLAVLRQVKAGNIPATLKGLTDAFKAVGHGADEARALLRDLNARSRARA